MHFVNPLFFGIILSTIFQLTFFFHILARNLFKKYLFKNISKMKNILLVLFMAISSLAFSQEGVTWLTDFQEAKQVAKVQNKPILMFLTGSDWCSPCKKLKKDFFESADFIEKSDALVLLKVDLPFREDIITPAQREKNQVLQKKYNPQKSFPLLIGFDSKGKELSRIASYSGGDPRYHFDFLNKLIP